MRNIADLAGNQVKMLRTYVTHISFLNFSTDILRRWRKEMAQLSDIALRNYLFIEKKSSNSSPIGASCYNEC